jgi:hypothetical protein
VSIVLKAGSLNLLETSGPVKACSGTALPSLVKGTTFLSHINMQGFWMFFQKAVDMTVLTMARIMGKKLVA